MNKGITLIETIIYIALVSLLMVGVISSVYMLMSSEGRTAGSREYEQKLILERYHE
jgi:Tfp pilus assembly protein PilE